MIEFVVQWWFVFVGINGVVDEFIVGVDVIGILFEVSFDNDSMLILVVVFDGVIIEVEVGGIVI